MNRIFETQKRREFSQSALFAALAFWDCYYSVIGILSAPRTQSIGGWMISPIVFPFREREREGGDHHRHHPLVPFGQQWPVRYLINLAHFLRFVSIRRINWWRLIELPFCLQMRRQVRQPHNERGGEGWGDRERSIIKTNNDSIDPAEPLLRGKREREEATSLSS